MHRVIEESSRSEDYAGSEQDLLESKLVLFLEVLRLARP